MKGCPSLWGRKIFHPYRASKNHTTDLGQKKTCRRQVFSCIAFSLFPQAMDSSMRFSATMRRMLRMA